MAGNFAGKTPDPAEYKAALIYQALSGDTTRFHDLDHNQSADYELVSDGKQVGLLEITSIRNEEMLRLANQLRWSGLDGMTLDASELEWYIVLVASQVAKIPTIQKKLEPLLRRLEAHFPEGIGFHPFSRSYNWEGTDPVIYDLFDLGVGYINATPSDKGRGRITIGRGERRAFGDDLPTALERTFDHGNRTKLSKGIQHEKRIQFVWVDRQHIAGSEMIALTNSSFTRVPLEIRLPALPEEITEVWAALEWEPGHVLIWRSDGQKWEFDEWSGDIGWSLSQTTPIEQSNE